MSEPTIDYLDIYESGLNAAMNIASITTWTPQSRIDWLNGYLDAHCQLLATIGMQTPQEWCDELLIRGQQKLDKTLEGLNNL